jgi:KDO2-lipid IV(A) lauroyltransferase
VARRNRAQSFLAWLPQAALIGLARALPYRARLAFASAVARALVALVPDLRRRVEGNLRLVFPDMPAAERRRIRSAMADSFGRTMIEVMTRRAFQARRAWTGPTGPGWDALQAARREGRGALLVSGHFGQWEAVRAALMANGIESGAMIRPVKNPFLNADYLANVEAGGRPVIGRDGAGIRELVRHLRRGGVMAILMDQYTKRGAPIDFLGHPAPSGTAIAELAIKYRLPMIPVYGTRQPDGLHVAVEFEAPIPPGTAVEMTQAAADSLAARVRADPGQYYWLHRRWVKRFDPPAPAAADDRPSR